MTEIGGNVPEKLECLDDRQVLPGDDVSGNISVLTRSPGPLKMAVSVQAGDGHSRRAGHVRELVVFVAVEVVAPEVICHVQVRVPIVVIILPGGSVAQAAAIIVSIF